MELDFDFRKMRDKLKKEGFREGSKKGYDDALQIAFNEGYQEGFRVAEAIGQLKGIKSCSDDCGAIDAPMNENESSMDQMFILQSCSVQCLQCSKKNENGNVQHDEETVLESLIKQRNHNDKVIEGLTHMFMKITCTKEQPEDS